MTEVDSNVAEMRAMAEEDWAVARELLDTGRIRHSLLMAYLALETALRAHLRRETRQMAPKVHNLVALAELAFLRLNQQQIDILAEANAFRHGECPDSPPPPNLKEAEAYLARAEGVFVWLIDRL